MTECHGERNERNLSIPHRFNKLFSSKFLKRYPLRQAPEKSWRIQQLKHRGDDNNQDEDISLINSRNYAGFLSEFQTKRKQVD